MNLGLEGVCDKVAEWICSDTEAWLSGMIGETHVSTPAVFEISTMSQVAEHGKSQSVSGNCCDEQCTFAAQCAVSAHWHKWDALKSGAALQAHGSQKGWVDWDCHKRPGKESEKQ